MLNQFSSLELKKILTVIIFTNMILMQSLAFADTSITNSTNQTSSITNSTNQTSPTISLPLDSIPSQITNSSFVIPFHPINSTSYSISKSQHIVSKHISSLSSIKSGSLLGPLGSVTSSINVHQQFEGINETSASCGCTPPDGAVAAGPNHIVEMVNIEGGIWTKNGTALRFFNLASFFGTGTDSISDPKVIFDTSSNRWFATILDITANAVKLASSQTTDPTQAWNIYSFPFTDCPDQPYLGVSNDKLAIGGNVYQNHCNGTFRGAQYTIINKTQVTSGLLASSFRSGLIPTESSMRPIQNLSSNSTLFMVSDDDIHSRINLHKVNGPILNLNFQNIPLSVNAINLPFDANQLGTSIPLSTGDDRIQDAVWYKQKLWLSLNDGCTPSGDSQQRSCVRLIELNATTNTILQDFDIGRSGFYFFYPSLKIDNNGALNVVFGNSSSTAYPSIMFTAQTTSDTPGTVKPLQILKSGTAPVTFLSSITGNIARYGDFFGSAVDPVNPSHVWVEGEYGSTISPWATFIGNTNTSPVANAGQIQTVPVGILVTLNGTQSSDPDGDTLTYSWTQTAGPVVIITNPNSVLPTFTSPSVVSNTVLTFKLVVSDGIATSQSTVNITDIPATCGVNIISGNPITYGTVNPGIIPINATNNPLILSNTGNVRSVLTTSGGNWTSAGKDIILASNTLVSNTTGIKGGLHIPLPLHNGQITINSNFYPAFPSSTYWQLIPNLLSSFAGSLSQQLTFTASC